MSRCYTITCASGTVALVRGASEAEVEREWDAMVDAGEAEERISGTTDRANRSEIARCVAMGHDYR